MIKYITNDAFFMTHRTRGTFNISKGLFARLNNPEYVRIYKSKDGCYIKLKPCGSDDLEGHSLTNQVNSAVLSSCELRISVDIKEKGRLYAWGTDTHGGVILRVKETDRDPMDFKLIAKETKLFIASQNSHTQKSQKDHIHAFRLSMELYRRLKCPEHLSLYIDRKKKRLYLKRSYDRVGSYKVSFTKTSINSGFAGFSVLNLKTELGVDIYDRVKFPVKMDMDGRYYFDTKIKILEKNSRGLR